MSVHRDDACEEDVTDYKRNMVSLNKRDLLSHASEHKVHLPAAATKVGHLY
jgi:hypothetical protein